MFSVEIVAGASANGSGPVYQRLSKQIPLYNNIYF